MSKEEVQKEIEAVKQERENLFEQRKPIDEKLKKLYDRLEVLKDDLTEIELTESRPFSEQVEYFLFEDGRVGGKRYEARSKFWHDYCGNLGLYLSGYHTQTQQSAFMIKLIKGNETSLRNHLQQITELLPYIKPVEDGEKVFQIFEHTLSRHGSYYFIINEELKEYTVKGGWSTEKFDDLFSALKYIQKNHYYDEE